MELKRAFGHVLRSIRGQRGLTREKLAELANVDDTFVYLLESGQRQPSLTTIFLFAKAFRIAPSELVRAVEAFNPNFSGRSEQAVKASPRRGKQTTDKKTR